MHKVLWWWFLSQFQCWGTVGGSPDRCVKGGHQVILWLFHWEPHRPSAFLILFTFTTFLVALQLCSQRNRLCYYVKPYLLNYFKCFSSFQFFQLQHLFPQASTPFPFLSSRGQQSHRECNVNFFFSFSGPKCFGARRSWESMTSKWSR